MSGYQPDEFNTFSGNHQQRAPYGMLLYDILVVYVFLSLYCCLSVGNKITTTIESERIQDIHSHTFNPNSTWY